MASAGKNSSSRNPSASGKGASASLRPARVVARGEQRDAATRRSLGEHVSVARKRVGRKRGEPTGKRPRNERSTHYAICVRSDDHPASLELRKLYAVLDDTFAEEHRLIRVVDESGEDYLYPDSYFVRVQLPSAVEQVLQKIA
jgi:hypothetical protein